jgi:hypothetical protein
MKMRLASTEELNRIRPLLEANSHRFGRPTFNRTALYLMDKMTTQILHRPRSTL